MKKKIIKREDKLKSSVGRGYHAKLLQDIILYLQLFKIFILFPFSRKFLIFAQPRQQNINVCIINGIPEAFCFLYSEKISVIYRSFRFFLSKSHLIITYMYAKLPK